ncbi:MAG TPA: hypothetical protein VFH66_01735 [Mycobacteriales bacterium]|nr:hypothetical protein [Mycobacteriales bacterium]
MRTRIVAASLAALVMTAAACDGRAGPSGPTPPRPSVSVAGRSVGLPRCDARPAAQVRVDRRTIDLLLLCPLETRPGPVVRLRSDSALFGPVILGLATPGRRYPPGTPCPAYADVQQTVLARFAHRWLVVDLPRDSCGHYDRGLLALLARARAG